MRGRMPDIFGVALSLLVFGILVFPKPAQADPHAVFYTAIGQRQLFFNFLAALDQADYVEPATGNLSREELAAKLKAADQTSTVSETLDETRTDLSAVLTRLITLDGTDLWTNYLALQIAKEAAQATDTTAYVELLCAQGLGRFYSGPKEFCDTHAPVGKASIDRKRAMVVDPQERTGVAYQHGLDIVDSSKDPESDYQKYLKYLDKPSTRDGDIAPDFPVPIDESIAALRAKTSKDPVKKLAIDRLSAAAAEPFQASYVNDNTFDFLKSTSDGSVELRDPGNIDGNSKIDFYMAAVQGISDLPQQFAATAARGVSIAEEHLAASETEGALAPVNSQSRQATKAGAQQVLLGREVEIASPPYVNREQIAAAFNALGSANAVPQGVPASADVIPGTDPEVDRNPDVAGTQDDQRAGRVLHATTPSETGRFQPQTVGLDFSTNPAPVHEETGGKHLLSAVTNGSRDRGGCGCGISHVLNDLGQAIVGKINIWKL